MDQVLCSVVHSKIQELIERLDHLIERLPEGQWDWKPATVRSFPAGVLLGHLMECLAGFCAVLFKVEPEHLRHFADLRELGANRLCDPGEARTRIGIYGARIREGFALLKDSDLGKKVPTVFVPDGEALLTLLLGNLEHLVNHKHQLFTYLQLMGVDVGSRDLYRFRGE